MTAGRIVGDRGPIHGVAVPSRARAGRNRPKEDD